MLTVTTCSQSRNGNFITAGAGAETNSFNSATLNILHCIVIILVRLMQQANGLIMFL
jgi:hypothetical protein